MRWPIGNSFMHQLKDIGADSPVSKIRGSGNQQGEVIVVPLIIIYIYSLAKFLLLITVILNSAGLNVLCAKGELLPPVIQQ